MGQAEGDDGELDLAAVEARWREARDRDSPQHIIASWCDVPALVRAVGRLRERAACAERATDALLDVVEAIDGVRPKSATSQALAAYVTAKWRRAGRELDEARAATRVAREGRDAARCEGAEAMRTACVRECERRAESIDRTAPDDSDLDDDDPATCELVGRFGEALDLAAALRDLPLPGVGP